MLPYLKTLETATIKQLYSIYINQQIHSALHYRSKLSLPAKKFYIIGPWDDTGSPEATNLLNTPQLFNCQKVPDVSIKFAC